MGIDLSCVIFAVLYIKSFNCCSHILYPLFAGISTKEQAPACALLKLPCINGHKDYINGKLSSMSDELPVWRAVQRLCSDMCTE